MDVKLLKHMLLEVLCNRKWHVSNIYVIFKIADAEDNQNNDMLDFSEIIVVLSTIKLTLV